MFIKLFYCFPQNIGYIQKHYDFHFYPQPYYGDWLGPVIMSSLVLPGRASLMIYSLLSMKPSDPSDRMNNMRIWKLQETIAIGHN